MRQHDRRLRQRDHLIEDVVGRMRCVEHDAEAIGFGNELLAERAQPFHSLPLGSVLLSARSLFMK